MKVIKRSVVNEDIENLMKDNNPEFNSDRYEDAVTALSPAYAQALKTEKNIKSRLGKDLKDMSKQGKEVTPPTPSIGKKVKTAYTAKEDVAEELDESLFEDAEELSEATKKKVEGMPDTVYELVYDRLFPGGVKAAKTLILKDNPISFDDSRYYSKGLGLYDIGVAVMNQEEADFVKSLADYLKLDYKFRNAKLKDNAIGVACILMDDDVGDKDTSEYLAEIGIKKPVRVKFSKKDLGEGKITRYYDVYTFEPSASASDAFDKIIEQGKLDALDAFIDNEYDGEIEDAKLDELLRWEPEYIFDAIGVEY
jgi:hypothetical protein